MKRDIWNFGWMRTAKKWFIEKYGELALIRTRYMSHLCFDHIRIRQLPWSKRIISTVAPSGTCRTCTHSHMSSSSMSPTGRHRRRNMVSLLSMRPSSLSSLLMHSIPGDTSPPWVNSGDDGNVKVTLSTFNTRVSVPPLPEQKKEKLLRLDNGV